MAREWVTATQPQGLRPGNAGRRGAMRASLSVCGVGMGLATVPMVAQAAAWQPPVMAPVAVATVSLLAGIVAVLVVALLACAYQLLRQRSRVQQLSLQTRAASLEAQRAGELLQATEHEKAELELQLRQQAESFARLAHEDDLSGLPNRRAFDDALSRNMAAARRNDRPLSLVVLSIDHLKQVNATWSRAVGDLVLCEVGELLRRSLRASDMPARLGNKEFAVLLGDTGLADAEQVCHRLQRLFAQYGQWGGRGEGEIKVTFSAGAVQMGEADLAPVLFYQRAKNALARAKQEGRARTCTASAA